MNRRYTAIISTISNSFCDFSLDYAISKYNIYQVLFLTSFVAMIGQLIAGLVMGISFTLISIPFVLLYGAIMLGGYFSFVKAIKIMPLGLTGLIESGSMFVVLVIDIVLGYLTLTPRFLILFLIFFAAIVVFSLETNKISDDSKRFSLKRAGAAFLKIITFRYTKEDHIIKKVTVKGLFFILLSIFLYCTEPYLVKLASFKGANEIAINLGYCLFGVTYFFISYMREQKNNPGLKKKFLSKKFILMAIAIGTFETIYYVFGTMSYINDIPIVVFIIQEIRVFLLVILSVIFKTDKMTTKKLIATIVAMAAVAGLYFS